MKKFNRLVRIPPPVYRALMFLGIAWALMGWAFDVVAWAIGISFAVGYAISFGRRTTSVTLEPFSKERGIVVWLHYRKQVTSARPRVVWDEQSKLR